MTATAHSTSAKCCDEYFWVLGSGGLPVEPLEKCPTHAKKPGATNKPADPAAPADAPDTRDGNKNKFAWFYEMLADTDVSTSAKVVGTGCCMKLAGRKGYFKATRKAIANLCGISQATVRRGLADLIDKRYLNADIHEGAASTYYLILPAQRWQEWLDAERAHEDEIDHAEREIKRWLWAEKVHEENQFRDAICEASLARGADQSRARTIGDGLLGKFRERGLEFNIEQGLAWVAAQTPDTFVPDQKRADPGSTVSRPRLDNEPTPVRQRADPGSTLSRPRLIADATTSADDQTHNSFKSFKEPERFLKDSETEPALRDALKARPPHGPAEAPAERNAGTCALCNDEGIFRDRFDYAVVLMDSDGYEYPVDCQHSMAANLAHIQRREKSEHRDLCKTGWPEIDCHYPLFDDGDSDEF